MKINHPIKHSQMKRFRLLYLLCLASLINPAHGQQKPGTLNPKEHAIIQTTRTDGRYVSSRGIVHAMMKNTQPALAFRPDLTAEGFARWQEELRIKMKEIMHHPDNRGLPAPKRIGSEKRDGYRLEKWESYPLPEAVVPYLVLVPDGVDARHSAPGVLCIPGSGRTKESLAGEPELEPRYARPHFQEENEMALKFVKMGLVSVVVDNPGIGESSDLEKYTVAPSYYFDGIARCLLELGWNYLGYSSYVDKCVLDWMKEQPYIQKERLIVSGHSLGTEPLMVLGVLDPSIYAFVYSDFLCSTRERILVMTEPYPNGLRPFPNSIEHLIPNFLCNFDFPDIVASLAPRPVIFTEGGLDRDLNRVQEAFRISGRPKNVEIHFYPKYADPANRKTSGDLPEGLNRDVYFDLTNVDAPMHCFKAHLILPWVKRILADPQK